MKYASQILGATGICAIAVLAATPALAGAPVGVPAPLLGAGAPALIAFAAGYWAIRKRRKG